MRSLGALLRRRRYSTGEVIFHEGDAGTDLYIIENGEVKIVLGSAEGQEVVLSLLGRGDFSASWRCWMASLAPPMQWHEKACDLLLLGR